MAKIERKTQKIFAGSGATDDVAAFGSFVSGTPVYTDDVEALQTTAYTEGWSSAIAANEAPFLEEMNGVQYGFSKQLAYLLETGVPEWDDGTTYYANTSFCQVNGAIYQSLTDDNIGNDPTTDTTNWKVYINPSDIPSLSGDNDFTGVNNFTGVLEYNGTEVLTQADAANTSLSNLSTAGKQVIQIGQKDFDYKQPLFLSADKSNVIIKAGTAILKKDSNYKYFENDTTYAIADVLDTGSVSNGKDYYFYLNNDGNLVASLNETAPSTGTEDNTIKIGGAHTLCVDVGDNAPALVDGDLFTTHPAAGYMANDFIPNSSWTPAFHSAAYTGNKGQVLISYGSFKFWSDIYLMSGTGTSAASSYEGTLTNNRQFQLMFNDLMSVGKYAPNRVEFMLLAMGSNQRTNIAGNALPSPALTGGYLDTAGKRMISVFFVESACGAVWQIGRNIAPTGGSSWSDFAITTRGAAYGVPYVLLLGGNGDGSTHCGSWALRCSANLQWASAGIGARGLSLHIEQSHA